MASAASPQGPGSCVFSMSRVSCHCPSTTSSQTGARPRSCGPSRSATSPPSCPPHGSRGIGNSAPGKFASLPRMCLLFEVAAVLVCRCASGRSATLDFARRSSAGLLPSQRSRLDSPGSRCAWPGGAQTASMFVTHVSYWFSRRVPALFSACLLPLAHPLRQTGACAWRRSRARSLPCSVCSVSSVTTRHSRALGMSHRLSCDDVLGCLLSQICVPARTYRMA